MNYNMDQFTIRLLARVTYQKHLPRSVVLPAFRRRIFRAFHGENRTDQKHSWVGYTHNYVATPKLVAEGVWEFPLYVVLQAPRFHDDNYDLKASGGRLMDTVMRDVHLRLMNEASVVAGQDEAYTIELRPAKLLRSDTWQTWAISDRETIIAYENPVAFSALSGERMLDEAEFRRVKDKIAALVERLSTRLDLSKTLTEVASLASIAA